MSHISKIKTKMMEKDFVIKSIQDLGYDFEVGDLSIKGLGQHADVEIKIKIPFSNDIGLRKSGEAYEIVADWWGVRGIKQNQFANSLMQRYAYHATISKLEEQGFTLVSEEVKEKEQIHLVLRRMA